MMSASMVRDYTAAPGMRQYVENFGAGQDHCLCAEVDGTLAGAVWTRMIHGFGSVDWETPELAISLLRGYRRKGIGTQLMQKMLLFLEAHGYQKVSLLVQKGNRAWHLYRNMGFEFVKETDEEWIMARRLGGKEADGFSQEHLQAAVDSLKTGYSMQMIDRELYEKCGENDWSRDFVSQFNSYDQYRELGLGMVVLKGDLLVSGASTYARYREGIEIEIDTREEYRGQGLAYACGAGLILECLERGLYPSWDAHDRRSVALAEKLGYHLDHGLLPMKCGISDPRVGGALAWMFEIKETRLCSKIF